MSVFFRPVSEGRPKYVIVPSISRVIYSVFRRAVVKTVKALATSEDGSKAT